MDSQALQRTALFTVCMSAFIAPLMLSAVNVAIPAIATGLEANILVLNWIPTAYLLSSAVFLLPFGRMADMFGRRRIYQSGMIVITVASILAATANTIEWLLFCRVLQGIGASMLFSTGSAILTSVFPPEKRGAALGISVSAVYLGLTCGPMVGGWATGQFGWRGVFLVHLPLALLVIGVTAFKLKAEWKDEHARKFDYAGSMIYALSIFAFMYGLSLLPTVSGFVIATLGIIGFVVFFQYAARADDPIFDVTLFRTNRMFTFSCLASLNIYSATFATSYLMSLYLQYIKGLSPEVAGVIIIGQPLMMAAISPFAGKLSDRIEPRVIASTGILFSATGLGLLSTISSQTSITLVFGFLMLIGIGIALFSSPNVNAIMSSVEKRNLGVAAGSVSTMRVLGQMNSMAVVTLVFALVLGPVAISAENQDLLMNGIASSFLVAACVAFTAIFVSLKRGNMRNI